eukprot:4391092-Amphidinium_carterae.1
MPAIPSRSLLLLHGLYHWPTTAAAVQPTLAWASQPYHTTTTIHTDHSSPLSTLQPMLILFTFVHLEDSQVVFIESFDHHFLNNFGTQPSTP